MDQKRPEDELHAKVYENKLYKLMGFLQHSVFEEVHDTLLECAPLTEKGNPRFHHIKPVKRIEFSLNAIAKIYELPKDERKEDQMIMNDVRAGDDVKACSLVRPNCYMLQVYDCSKYCVIYEHYFYNLEEFCQLQIHNLNVRPKLKSKTVDFLKMKQLVESDYRITPFFREFMQHTLNFLKFLRARDLAYGGLHPHNILIVDEECTIKFRGLKEIKYIDGNLKDLEDFVRLVRFCAHGGGRDINDTDNDEKICKEAKEFLSIFVDSHHPSRSNYVKGFGINQLNILKHPLFWDESMCMQYFLQTHALLVACDLTLKKFDLGTKMYNFQANLDVNVAKARIDLQAVNVETPYPYNPGDVIDHIIKSIRNFEGHYPDGLDGDNSAFGYLGSHPECWNALRRDYPGLITGVHKVMMTYTKYISPLFKSHWGKFYPHVYK